MTNKNIEVVPYNPQWPTMFETEAKAIQAALGENCMAVHHVGSTSVPQLAAKPKIDIITVIKNRDGVIEKLEAIGYVYKGEYNIPFHLGFSKRKGISVNLHIYEEGNPEIELNLLFRDYLRNHPEARQAYQDLKLKLVSQKELHVKRHNQFSGYNLGKDAFIKDVLKKARFNRLCMRFCVHDDERAAVLNFRKQYFTEKDTIDPLVDPFNQQEHIHLVLYQGIHIIGYANIELTQHQKDLSPKDALLRMMIIQESHRGKAFDKELLNLCEKWVRLQGYSFKKGIYEAKI